MTVQKEPDAHALGGWSYILDAAADLAALPPSVRTLVPRATLDPFVGHPDVLRERAARCRFAPLARWLHSLARERCVLEVHCPEAPLEPSVMLRFPHSGRRWSPAIEPVPSVSILAPCPDALREVYELAGGINTAYAGSGLLLAPARLYTAHELVERVWKQTPPGLREHAFYGSLGDYPGLDLKRAVSLWEADGDVLFWTPQGSTFWLGHEHYGGQPGADWGPLDAALGRIFEALLRRESFHAD